MEKLRTPDEWYAIGEAIYRDVVMAFARYGVRPDPQLRFIHSDTPTAYYEIATQTIGFGVPDPEVPAGRLYLYLVQNLVGTSDLAETQRAMEVPLAWSITHEVAHHLRHRYGAPITNDFVEEQIVNCIAIALLSEHPRYASGLPALKDWANRIYERTRSLSPETEPYLRGFRFETGDVLVSQGVIEPSALREARRLSRLTGAASDEILLRAGKITAEHLADARAEREATESYFNRRYMTGLREYWLFGTEWLSRYLERDDLPTAGEALERYILTEDWEASQRDATWLLLEQALGSPDPIIASTAATGLAEIGGSDAIPPLVAVLDDPRPAVRSASLQALELLPGGPEAGARKAIAMLERNDVTSRPAARLLKAAGVPLGSIGGDAPVVRAQTALARRYSDPDFFTQMGELLDGDEASVLAALDALGESGPGPFNDRVTALLNDSNPDARAAAIRALGPANTSLPALMDRVSDPHAQVRQAARDMISRLDGSAWPGLREVLLSAPDAIRVEVLGMVSHNAMPDAPIHLESVGASLIEQAERLASLESASTGEALSLLAQAAREERQRLARLSLRALGRLRDPAALDLIEPALDSLDPGHRTVGRDLVRASLGGHGVRIARMLEPVAMPSERADSEHLLDAYARETSIILRGLAAFVAANQPGRETALDLLHRLSSDPEPFVREEAQAALHRLRAPLEATMLTTVEKVMFLRSVPTFAECPVDTLRLVSQRCVVQQFEAGETILREGEPGQHFYIISEGRVAITTGGRQIDELGPRQYLGEMALFDGGPRSATASSLAPTTVLRLDRDDFYRLGRDAPELLIGVIRVLSARVRANMARATGQTVERDGPSP